MTDKKHSSLGPKYSYLEEGLKMKENGASNTQLREFLESHGWTGIVFHDDDRAVNPGIKPTTTLTDKQFNDLINQIKTPDTTDLVTGKKELNLSDIGQPLSIDIETSKHFDELGNRLIDDLMDPRSLISPFPILSLKAPKPLNDLKENHTEPSLYDGRPVNQFGPRGEVSSMDTAMFAKPISSQYDLPIIRELQKRSLSTPGAFEQDVKGFAPVFDAEIARRYLYKDLLVRMNEEISKGPLKGCITFTGVTSSRIAPAPIQFVFSVTWSHKSRNRMKAYDKYFNSLKNKYLLEIAEAEAKVMERE